MCEWESLWRKQRSKLLTGRKVTHRKPHLFRKFICGQRVRPLIYFLHIFCWSCMIIKKSVRILFLANQYSVKPSLPQRVQVVSDVAVGGEFLVFPLLFSRAFDCVFRGIEWENKSRGSRLACHGYLYKMRQLVNGGRKNSSHCNVLYSLIDWLLELWWIPSQLSLHVVLSLAFIYYESYLAICLFTVIGFIGASREQNRYKYRWDLVTNHCSI